MRLFGYKDEGLPPESVHPGKLAEVTLEASPAELRTIASFLLHAAGEMERMGSTYGHLHLSDAHRAFEASPHFVVVRGASGHAG